MATTLKIEKISIFYSRLAQTYKILHNKLNAQCQIQKNCPLDPSKNFIKTCTGEDGDLKLNFLNIKQPKNTVKLISSQPSVRETEYQL